MLWGHVLSLFLFDMFFAMGTSVQWSLATATALVLLLVLLHNQTTQESCVLVAFRLCACSRKAKSKVVRVPFSKISEVLVVELSQELEPSSCLDELSQILAAGQKYSRKE